MDMKTPYDRKVLGLKAKVRTHQATYNTIVHIPTDFSGALAEGVTVDLPDYDFTPEHVHRGPMK